VRYAVAAAVALLLGACAETPPAVPPYPQLVLISVDGLRPDALAAAPARNIQALQAGGAWSHQARAVGIPETLPSHVTMVTGLRPRKHGVTYNNNRGETLKRPTIFTRVQEAGGSSALLFGKSKLAMLTAPGAAKTLQGPGKGESDSPSGADRALAARFARELPKQRFRFAMIHLRAPDYAGHEKGWMSEAYLAAVREADEAVGVVLQALADNGLAQHAAVILTADHGGAGTHHRHADDLSWTIPWICRAPGAQAGEIREPITLLDVAPTALALLELPPLPGAQGKPVRACLAS
jgi:predicted AlkP superfamily pyrophosphatase or phosphodiesterase